MKIGIFGGSGFVGSFLREKWLQEGNTVQVFQRDDSERPLYWNPEAHRIDPSDMEGLDLVVDLSGESLQGRWSAAKKQRILKSRVAATSLIATAISHLNNPPKLWINASAIGYYGNRGDTSLDESASKGDLFLSEVVDEWEKAALPAEGKTRLVFSRFGIVLDPAGGALQKMLMPFKLGLGGPIGPGDQWMSFISLLDLKEAMDAIVAHTEIAGPVNFVSPEPVTSKTFTTTLAKVLGRPHVLPLPAFALRLILGEAADEMLLASTKVIPKKLKDAGYVFKDPSLEPLLKRLLD